jgi:hypothetical protein
MNLKEILVAERDKTQLMAESLMHVVTSLNATIEALDKVQLPIPAKAGTAEAGTVELRIGDGEKPYSELPKANAKVVANAVPAERPGMYDHLGADGIAPPANEQLTDFKGEITVKQAQEKYGVRANVIALWKKYGRVLGSDGHVNVVSLEAKLNEGRVKERLATENAQPKSEDEITYAEAAELIGTTVLSLGKNQVYKGQVKRTRSGYVTRESVDGYISQRDSNPQALAAKRRYDRIQRVGVVNAEKPVKEKFKFDEPKPIVKDLQTGPWEPEFKVGDSYQDEQKTAKQMDVNEDWLRTVKKSGRIAGAPGWINVTQLEAYLKHPEFVAPFIDKARM